MLTAIILFFSINSHAQKSMPVVHSKVGDKLETKNGELTVTCIGQKHGFGKGESYDADIRSPKSASFVPGGEKFYVNSLEGGKTVAYKTEGLEKIKTISHNFESGTGPLWLAPSGYYEFTHYPGGENKSFMGKPVEEAITRDGKYMFVPYYRRTFDINAQDPSALAVIDVEKDEIILMTETGPLPKMVALSNSGNLLAITHWGNNTVGFLDISDEDPHKWHHLPPITIGNKLNLNYSLTKSIDRDSGSGYSLRGTVFLPGDSLLLISGMGGPLAVIDVKKMEWIGMIPSLSQMRHVIVKGENIYMSRNSSGEVFSVPLDSLVQAIGRQRGSTREFKIPGIKHVKVGGGARTLKASPSGKYLFVACNSSSALYVVDSEKMEVIGSLAVDSFPVGLDISPDGKYIVVTSQGRKNGGGNAVNIYEIEYSDPAEEAASAAVAAELKKPQHEEPEIKETVETNSVEKEDSSLILWIGIGLLGILVVSGIIGFYFRRKRGIESRG